MDYNKPTAAISAVFKRAKTIVLLKKVDLFIPSINNVLDLPAFLKLN
jgi:hypothetical protein